MKKQMVAVLFLSVLTVAGSAYAQSVAHRANVPFDFIVGGTSLPAGEYTIESINSTDKLLLIRSADGNGKAMTLSHSVISRRPTEKSELIFSQYGGEYFLAQIWTAGNDAGRELPTGKCERRLAENHPPLAVVVLTQLVAGK